MADEQKSPKNNTNNNNNSSSFLNSSSTNKEKKKKVSGEIIGSKGGGSSNAFSGHHHPNQREASIPDAATLRDQWRFAIRQYSKWYSHAWGTAILAGASFFALGWIIKGSNPLPSSSKKQPQQQQQDPLPSSSKKQPQQQQDQQEDDHK